MQQGKVDEAIAELHESWILRPRGSLWNWARPITRKAIIPKAIEYLKKATAEDPANEEATQLLGLSYYAGGHPAEAIPLLEKVQGWVFARQRGCGSTFSGSATSRRSNYDQARKSFGKMFDVPGDSAAAYLFTARMLLRQEYDPIAEEYAQKAAALDPKLPLVHFLLGEAISVQVATAGSDRGISERTGHQSGERSDLLQAGGRVLANSEIRRGRAPAAALDLARRDVDRALHPDGEGPREKRRLTISPCVPCKHAVTMDPNNPTTHHLLGQTYRDMGKKEEAESELKLAEELQTRSDKNPCESCSSL